MTVYSLGTLRSGPQILQVSAQANNFVPPPGPAVIDGSAVIVGSSLAAPVSLPSNASVTLTITGGPFLAGDAARLDGSKISTTFVNSRQITALVPASLLSAPHRYAVDVIGSNGVSNASSFTVIQSVDLTTGNTCSGPLPQGVAIDDNNDLAVVSEPGCSNVAIVDLASGTAATGKPATVPVGSGPFGVATLPSAGLAVVANYNSGTASVVDEINGGGVVATATTDQSPIGVAVDLGTGNALVAANGGNVLDVFAASASPGTPTTNAVGQGPVGVSVDPASHLAAVSNGSAGTASLVDLTGTVGTTTASGLSLPEGIALDPCNTTANGYCATPGFVVANATGNELASINPQTGAVTPIRVGINPTSVAYNFNSSTMITANPLSQTISVVDFLDQTVRAVFSATPSSLFGVAIVQFPSPSQTNMAVIADTMHNQLLMVPLPR